MKRVVALAEGEQCDEPVVARRDFRVVLRRAERVRQRVHEERGVVNQKDAEEAAPQQAGNRVAEQRADRRRKSESADDEDHLVPAVLPHHDRVLQQVGRVLERVRRLVVLVEDPDDVRPPEAALDVVGVPVAVDVLVMHAMAGRPPEDRVLRRHRPEDRVQRLHQARSLVALV